MTVELCNLVSAPKSLDEKFFLEVIENGLFEANIVIKKITFEMGTSGGDNYCSQIYRVRLTFQRGSGPLESISVIVKSILVTDSTDFINDWKVFLKEKIFYSNIQPKMQILLNKVKIGAKVYHTRKEPINTLVFEDLTALGYIMADREKGLDFDHCQLVLRKLGQFHGVSMLLQKKEPDLMSCFGHGLLCEEIFKKDNCFENIFSNYIDGLIRSISNWHGYETITEKIRKYATHLKETLMELQRPISGELKVLNHGDLWVNNMLFKYTNDNSGQVEDVLYVDLQQSIYGSPGFDINYFFYTSLQLDVLKEKRTDLLHIYHDSMCATLHALGYEYIPSFDDILTEVRRRETYGFFTVYGILPTILIAKEHSANNSLDSLMDKESAKQKCDIIFSSKRMVETLRYTLKRFDELGVLD